MSENIEKFWNLTLATYMFGRLIQVIISNEINQEYIIVICITGSIFYFLNLLFTITICTDGKLYDKYVKQWKEVLNLHN